MRVDRYRLKSVACWGVRFRPDHAARVRTARGKVGRTTANGENRFTAQCRARFRTYVRSPVLPDFEPTKSGVRASPQPRIQVRTGLPAYVPAGLLALPHAGPRVEVAARQTLLFLNRIPACGWVEPIPLRCPVPSAHARTQPVVLPPTGRCVYFAAGLPAYESVRPGAPPAFPWSPTPYSPAAPAVTRLPPIGTYGATSSLPSYGQPSTRPGGAWNKRAVHHLKYVPAIDAANALNGIFASEGGVLVVAEPVSNSLLINAVPGVLEEVTRLADQIDQPPATVTIDVSLAEIKLSAPGRRARTGEKTTVALRKGTVPFSLRENRDSPPLVPSPVLSYRYPPGTGRCEPRSSVSSDDIDAQLAALRKQGELKTLFRSSLMTLDNQPASICISGNTFHVTPRVAADRLGNATALVIMEIHLVLIRTPGGELIATQPAIEVPSSFPRLFVSAMPCFPKAACGDFVRKSSTALHIPFIGVRYP